MLIKRMVSELRLLYLLLLLYYYYHYYMQCRVVTKINRIWQGGRNYSVLPLLANQSKLNILLLVTFHSFPSGQTAD